MCAPALGAGTGESSGFPGGTGGSGSDGLALSRGGGRYRHGGLRRGWSCSWVLFVARRGVYHGGGDLPEDVPERVELGLNTPFPQGLGEGEDPSSMPGPRLSHPSPALRAKVVPCSWCKTLPASGTRKTTLS